jgi:hypothetical protein
LPDLNMQTALDWGREFSDMQQLPASLADVSARVKLVQAVNQRISIISLRDMQESERRLFLRDVFKACNGLIAERFTENEKISIGLRMWSGCLSAAKAIAGGTRENANTKWKRETQLLDITQAAESDIIFRTGVEAAPAWKQSISQGDDIFFDGVPIDSPVRRYWSEGEGLIQTTAQPRALSETGAVVTTMETSAEARTKKMSADGGPSSADASQS